MQLTDTLMYKIASLVSGKIGKSVGKDTFSILSCKVDTNTLSRGVTFEILTDDFKLLTVKIKV